METKEYFKSVKGMGVMATSDGDGNVNAAVYARPTVMEDGTVAFIMNDRLSHHYLESNPRAAYLFIEDGPGYKGRRLHLKVNREETDSEKIAEISRRTPPPEREEKTKFLVFFDVEKEMPLIGG